jgi:hypothetical protein
MSAGFPVVPAHQIAGEATSPRWLVEGLWGEEAVGIIGGEPKCGKTFLALGLAVAVASGRPCLGRFPVHTTGRVLLFAAEDAPVILRSRLEKTCAHFGLELKNLDLWALATPTLRLDCPEDCQRLEQTVAELQPSLLILDPFVRLHRVDENVSAAVVPLLAFLRDLQRRYHLAIAVVHHARKGAAHLRPGQALRGSSEFHAWADSSLHLRRKGDAILLCAEHRAHPSPAELTLTLCARPSSLALVAEDGSAEPDQTPDAVTPCDRERVLLAIRSAPDPLSTRRLRSLLRVRTQTLCQLLQDLSDRGVIQRTPEGWRYPASCGATQPSSLDASPAQLPFPFPAPSIDTEGNGNRKQAPSS